jgi:hypothetical protein
VYTYSRLRDGVFSDNAVVDTEAAKCLRENRQAFEQNVHRALRGGTVDGISYERLI